MAKTFSARGVVTLKFNPGALMKGRVVKTQPYSRTTVTHFRDCNLDSTKDIQSWCNLRMRVESCDLRRKVVTLRYSDKHGYEIVEWPIDCIDQNFGIKIN